MSLKVALVLSGQMRTFDHKEVVAALRRYVSEPLQCDVFASVWDRRGYSYCHGDGVKSAQADDIVTPNMLHAAYPNLKRVHIESIDSWIETLPTPLRVMYDEGYVWDGMKITGTFVPQFYKIWDANRLKQEYELEMGFQYDVVIRCRPDNLFECEFLRDDLLNVANQVYAINSPPHYWPNRVYDIMFFSDSPTMDKLANAFWELETLSRHPFQNGLHAKDACRMLYAQCLRKNIQVRDLPNSICVVKR